MPEAVAFDRVALRYLGAARDTVGPVTFALHEGERLLVLGASGTGKSSLLHSVTGLVPRAIACERRGGIAIHGRPTDSRSPADWADTVGYLFQDADQTLAGFTVSDEVAFALENRGVAGASIPDRVAAALDRVGLPRSMSGRTIAALSGGEKQLVALASLLAQDAAITLADEPAASLAPQAGRRAADLCLAPGRTTLLVDHKPWAMLDRIDRVIAIGCGGQIIAQGTPRAVIRDQAALLHAERMALPLALRLHLALPCSVPPHLSTAKALRAVPRDRRRLERIRDAILPKPCDPAEVLVSLERVACAPPRAPVVLQEVSLDLRAGEVLAILGRNGAGKSTLAACLAGLIRPRAGQRNGARGAIVFQNPEAQFSRETVRAELARLHAGGAAIADVLKRWHLDGVAGQHPYTLSQGQKRRLALALVMEDARWPFVILDEPTSGLDGAATRTLSRQVRALAGSGRGVGVITHDLDFALAVADRAILLADGGLRFDGPCAALMRDAPRLQAAGLLRPEAATVLEWLDA